MITVAIPERDAERRGERRIQGDAGYDAGQRDRKYHKETDDIAAEERYRCTAIAAIVPSTSAIAGGDQSDHHRVGQRRPHAFAVQRGPPPLQGETARRKSERLGPVERVDDDEKQWRIEEYQDQQRSRPGWCGARRAENIRRSPHTSRGTGAAHRQQV